MDPKAPSLLHCPNDLYSHPQVCLSLDADWGWLGSQREEQETMKPLKKGINHNVLEGRYLSVNFITHIDKPLGPTSFICIRRELDFDIQECSFHHP